MDYYTGKVCTVSGYDRDVRSTEIRVGTGIPVWDDPLTGQSHLLQVNEGLDMRNTIDNIRWPTQTIVELMESHFAMTYGTITDHSEYYFVIST